MWGYTEDEKFQQCLDGFDNLFQIIRVEIRELRPAHFIDEIFKTISENSKKIKEKNKENPKRLELLKTVIINNLKTCIRTAEKDIDIYKEQHTKFTDLLNHFSTQ